MNSKAKDTRWLTSVALMAAIVILLANTPFGMIQLPIIKATTVHIPVIIGAVVLGPMAGAILGGVLGVCSMISNTLAPNLSSFAFSPFMSTTGIVGAIKAVWISVGCRVMIGVVSGWLWIFLRKMKMNRHVALAITGFVGSMTNTIMVMGSIFILLANEYSAVRGVEGRKALWGVIMVTITSSGVPEAIAAMILVTMIGTALLYAVTRIPNYNRGH